MTVIAIGGVVLLCVLLYRFAIHAMPAYLGFVSAFWAFGCGAGAGSVLVGIGVAFGGFTLARRIAEIGDPISRTLVVALFALPAAYAGFEIIEQLGVYLVPSLFWRFVFALFGAFAIGIASAARLAPRAFVKSANS